MKKTKYILTALLIGSACGMSATGENEVELRIVHTNDTHSCIMPVSPHSSDTALADKGGFVRRAALVRDLRAEDNSLLLFDSGDFSQGSAYYNLYKGEVEVKLMNEMRYDAATIGNHEFDFGLENMARIFRMAGFPIVCANYDFSGTALEPLVKPYVIVEKAGKKIGIFGLTTSLRTLVARQNLKGIVYMDAFASADKWADYLKNVEKCDLVIALTHLGYSGYPDQANDVALAKDSENIDIIIGGHSHTFLKTDRVYQNRVGRDVVVVQAGAQGEWVGRFDINFK